MNRHQRRAAAAKARGKVDRTDLIRTALDVLAANQDQTVTGATLVMPSGETVYLPVSTVRATVKPGAVQ